MPPAAYAHAKCQYNNVRCLVTDAHASITNACRWQLIYMQAFTMDATSNSCLMHMEERWKQAAFKR